MMKRWLVALLAAVVTAGFAAPPDSSWFTNFDRAQAVAKETKRPMYVLFTGSDWCPWCIRLHNEVLEKPKFRKFLQENFVPVFLDFPRNGKQVPPENVRLMKHFGVEGFPTIIVTSPQGKPLGTLGYSSLNDQLDELRKFSR